MILKKKPWGSLYSGELAKGCQQCIKGEKMVVFISNKCTSDCFYCPLSNERKLVDITLANERPIKSQEEIIIEAELMDAKGASLTGGDPLEHHSIDKSYDIAQLLKNTFGNGFHIHTYTRGKEVTVNSIRDFEGLINEIRFHVKNIKKDFNPIRTALDLNFDIGIEIPVIPIKSFDYYRKILEKFQKLKDETDKFLFVNLNELEVSETNYRNFVLPLRSRRARR